MSPGKYLAGGLQSGRTANLIGAQYKIPPHCMPSILWGKIKRYIVQYSTCTPEKRYNFSLFGSTPTEIPWMTTFCHTLSLFYFPLDIFIFFLTFMHIVHILNIYSIFSAKEHIAIPENGGAV